MNPTEREALLAVFRRAAATPAPPEGHVADDPDLLTDWRLGNLSPAEEERFLDHLDACAACRKAVAQLPAPEETPAPATPTAEPAARSAGFPRAAIWGAVLALAACVMIAVWVTSPSAESVQLARAADDLKAGRPDAALDRLAKIRADRLDRPTKGEHDRLLEEAAYQSGRAALEAGRFDAVDAAYAKATTGGTVSGRLENLKLLADRKIPGEVVLVSAGHRSLLDRGFIPAGRRIDRGIEGPNAGQLGAWEAAVKMYPNSAELRLNYGEALLSLNRYDDAAREFREAIRIEPANPAGYNGLGMALAANDRDPDGKARFDKALAQFREAEKLTPDSSEVLLNVATALEGKGDRAAAKPYWEKALPKVTDPKVRDMIQAHLNPEE